jgi:predicted ATPase
VSGLFVHSYLPVPRARVPSWVAQVPAFRALQHRGRIPLRQQITCLTGENGVGKSTLLEGIAVSCGFNSAGGAFTSQVRERENPLRGVAAVARGNRAMEGYFLRAESHFSVAGRYNRDHAGVDLHRLSHGESVLHIVQESFHAQGLYLLDEPESGLSLIRQMTLLAELHQVAAAGAQIILVTHSPVLLALPGARILEFTTEGDMLELELEQTTSHRALRDFLADTRGIADYMVEVTRACLLKP